MIGKSVKRLKDYFPLVQLLAQKKVKVQQFKSIIRSINSDAVKFICECCKNVISTSYVSSLPHKKRKSLLRAITPYKTVIKSLCKKRKNYNKNKTLINQKGYGFLIPILTTIIPLIASLIAKRTKK